MKKFDRVFSTKEAHEAFSLLKDSKKIVLTTHKGPDGDGIASEIALYMVLENLGKDCMMINNEPVPKRYRYLENTSHIKVYCEERKDYLLRSDLVVLVDGNELKRTGIMEETLSKRTLPIIAIDHHPPSQCSIRGIIGEDFSSVGELMVHVIMVLGAKIEKRIANLLYSAILYDTHQFRFVRNDPEVFEIASFLISSGADAEGTAKRMFGSMRRDQFVLLGRAMDRAQFEKDGRLAWSVVIPEMLFDLKVDPDEVRAVVMNLADIEGVEVAVLFKMFKEGEVRVSMRSRGSVSVLEVAQRLGGGGHPNAAGADLNMPLQEAIEMTLSLLRAQFK